MPGPLGTGSGGGSSGTATAVFPFIDRPLGGSVNSGVTSLAGTGISVSAATGSVTVTPTYAAPTALTIGGTVVTGAAASVSNSAHVHAMPGSAVAGASAVGDTAATGSATTVALSDHKHSREAFGTPIAVTGGATAASGSATTIARSDHAHSTASMPVLLASTTLGSAAASYTFSSIPSTYNTLGIIFCTQTSYSAGGYDYLGMQFNGDTTSSYYMNQDFTLISSLRISAVSCAGTLPVNEFAGGQILVLNYKNASIRKSSVSFTVNPYGTSTRQVYAAAYSGVWQNTSAITSLTVLGYQGNLVAGSTFQLYGYP